MQQHTIAGLDVCVLSQLSLAQYQRAAFLMFCSVFSVVWCSMRLADYLSVKDIFHVDALLVEQGSCSLAAVMKDFGHFLVAHQVMKTL